MHFMDHIERCNKHDLSNFVPLVLLGNRIGWVKYNLLPCFAGFPQHVAVADTDIQIKPHLNTALLLEEAMGEIGLTLYEKGLTNSLLNEFYPVGQRFGQNLFELNRASVPAFGVRAYGIHLTGFVRKSGRILVWVPRRAADRVVFPGKWDNTVAGGQPAGISLQDNLVKECAEEANIGPDFVAQARPVGTISYRHELQFGLRDDLIFAYDLELPMDFQPRNRDGEVEDFQLWPVERVMEEVAGGIGFKFNCNLVLIDFFIRHGLFTNGDENFDVTCQELYGGGHQ